MRAVCAAPFPLPVGEDPGWISSVRDKRSAPLPLDQRSPPRPDKILRVPTFDVWEVVGWCKE
jgi:hypothetical protein